MLARKMGWMLGVALLFGCADDGEPNSESTTDVFESEVIDGGMTGEGDEAAAGDDSVASDTVDTEEEGDGAVELPSSCCSEDSDCDAALVCVAGDGGQGQCSTFPPKGLCWTDAECGFGEVCEGASICPCNIECLAHEPGTCSGNDGCCETNEDCAGGKVCAEGACKEIVGGGCFSDENCAAGMECIGEYVCPCGSTCVQADSAGECLPAGLNCCVSDGDCASGSICENSLCTAPLVDGACQTDSDCEGGSICEGGNPACGCTAECVDESAIGECVFPNACCVDGNECGDSQVCAAGTCVDAIELNEGQCLVDDDCAEGSVCVVEVCPCNEPCSTTQVPGKCAVQE